MDEPYSFRFVAAPDDLAPYLNSLYVWRTERPNLDDVLPAYSGQLVLFAQGRGEMKFPAQVSRTSEAFILGPLLQARPFRVYGPAVMFGVSLNFRGWHALTGLDVTLNHDRLIAPHIALPPALADEMTALAAHWRSGTASEEEILAALADIVRRGLQPLPERSLLVIDRTLDWLSSSFKPDLEALYAALPFSERQIQRLVAQFFGQPPLRLLRRYRAVRAATLLSMPDLAPEIADEIRDAFYDQAHLIKEIRHFTGRTPRLLTLPEGGSVVTEMLGPEGYSAVDLFGGSQDQQLRGAAQD